MSPDDKTSPILVAYRLRPWFGEETSEGAGEPEPLGPYTHTFEEVQMADLGHKRLVRYRSEGRRPGDSKLPISLAVRDWLLDKYPHAWPAGALAPDGPPEFQLIGFSTRLFATILGIECGMPHLGDIDASLPPAFWLTDHWTCDLGRIVRPSPYADHVPWAAVIEKRGVRLDIDNWTGPGDNMESDLTVIAELAAQLGILIR